MKLLFITQKLKQQDAFGVLWVREFIAQGYDVEVVCLEGDSRNLEFPVHTLGKERGWPKWRSILEFYSLIWSLKYDRVFVHMAPVWYALGWWTWLLKRVPAYLWYTHYKMQWGVRLFGWFGKRFFAATEQSLPQYNRSPKKVVVGHGIDMHFWPKRTNQCKNPQRLLTVHRLSRSKRLELSIKALLHLPSDYTLDVYGIEAEKDYVAELRALVETLKLNHRVTFHGTKPMDQLPSIYVRHRLILNMASETIDKTMLEAMTCGCYPVTTAANAKAIGIPAAPEADTPEAIAAFVQKNAAKPPVTDDEMYRVVNEGHSLHGLVAKMDAYMRKGD
jgi:glycosyltransferase involved in cell wall biosynthesis